MSVGAINIGKVALTHFDQATSVRYFRLCYLGILCSVICRTCLENRLLEDCLKIQFFVQSSHKCMFLSERKPFKNDSNDYISNQWFSDLFYIICRAQICRPSFKFKFPAIF